MILVSYCVLNGHYVTITSCLRITYMDRVPESMPLYDILNEFQKGHSHMAVVVRRCDKNQQQSSENYANGKNML